MRQVLRHVFPLSACLALIAALLMPRIVVQRPTTNTLAIVDITQSMNVLDENIAGEAVSRLDYVKHALLGAVDELPCGSKLGLGIFTQYRSLVLLTPIETCANAHELRDVITGINGQMSWAGGSEIAKGVYLTLRMLKTMETPPALVFFTDGHEAPPVNPLHRIALGDEAGVLSGLLIGIGGTAAAPIPRFDPEGSPAGFWGPHDVMQEDLYAHGRQGTVADEKMEETGPAIAVPPALRRTPGQEHLSSLREPYLQLLATEGKLLYARLNASESLAPLLEAPALAQDEQTSIDVRWLAGVAALLALLVPYAARLASVRRYPATSSIARPIE